MTMVFIDFVRIVRSSQAPLHPVESLTNFLPNLYENIFILATYFGLLMCVFDNISVRCAQTERDTKRMLEAFIAIDLL